MLSACRLSSVESSKRKRLSGDMSSMARARLSASPTAVLLLRLCVVGLLTAAPALSAPAAALAAEHDGNEFQQLPSMLSPWLSTRALLQVRACTWTLLIPMYTWSRSRLHALRSRNDVGTRSQLQPSIATAATCSRYGASRTRRDICLLYTSPSPRD